MALDKILSELALAGKGVEEDRRVGAQAGKGVEEDSGAQAAGKGVEEASRSWSQLPQHACACAVVATCLGSQVKCSTAATTPSSGTKICTKCKLHPAHYPMLLSRIACCHVTSANDQNSDTQREMSYASLLGRTCPFPGKCPGSAAWGIEPEAGFWMYAEQRF